MSSSEQSSSEEDEDYVPEEYDSDEEESRDEDKKNIQATKEQTRVRRQGGIKLYDPDDNIIEDVKERNKKESEEEEILIKQKEKAAKKAKEEELWAAFKKDTGIMAQKSSKATPSQIPSSSSSKKVSITKTYDFAGESVM
ncbi:hypothetical protein ACROYT_G013766 [Oculina patagonica]